jgi:RES domain-containing protein
MTIVELKNLWRISNHHDMSGKGGGRIGARWHTAGSRIVYLAESPTAALVETLVHLEVESEDTPDFYTLLKIVVHDELAIQPLDPPAGSDWKQDLRLTRGMGDAWLASRETPLARVPSAIAPHTWNYLLNPEHPDAKQVQVAEVIEERFDSRLFRFGAQ